VTERERMIITVRRLANLFYLYQPEQITWLIDEYTIPVLAYDLGIFKRDSQDAETFSHFTTQLQFLVDAIHLIDLEGKGRKLTYHEKKKMLDPGGFSKKEIKNPILFVWDFFNRYPVKFARLELYFWLYALIEFQTKENKPLEKNEIFHFFLTLHEIIEVSYLLNGYLKSLGNG
jgi:hypothetical protein